VIELAILVAAVFLVALAWRPVFEWLWMREWKGWMDHLERQAEERRKLEYMMGLRIGFTSTQRSAHGVITGITS
jgi:hypothetical protein